MKRVIAVLAGVLAFTATAVAAPPQLEHLDRAMQELVAQGAFAGTATVVYKDGKLVGRQAFGKRDLASGAPMRPDTIVRAYSMTKPVTAVAMMILYEQGKWRPEDPVAKFLPELAGVQVFRRFGPDGEAVLEAPAAAPTMGQLLTHTAGFSYGFDLVWVDDRYRKAELWSAASADDFVARVATLPLAYEPGQQWRYSISMDLQGAIIERLSGMSLAEFMQRHIFTPLRMRDTGFHVPAAKVSRLATLYEWKNDALQPVTEIALNADPTRPPKFASGGGGLFSTADDYARFALMLLGNGTYGGQRIISETSARQMMSNHLSPAIVNGRYGIGLQQIRPGYQFGYNGVVVTDPSAAQVALGAGSYLWDGMASTCFWVDPTNRIVFVGMVQRIVGLGMPLLQPISQKAVQASFADFEPGVN